MKKISLIVWIIFIIAFSFITWWKWYEFWYLDRCLDMWGWMNPWDYDICVIEK